MSAAVAAVGVTALTVIGVVAATAAGRAPVRIVEPGHGADDRPADVDAVAPHRFVTRRVLAVAAAAVATIALGPLLTAALVGSVAGARRWRSITAQRAERRRCVAVWPDVVDVFVVLVHAGLTPRLAVSLLAERGPAPLRPVFAQITRRIGRGEPFTDAIGRLPDTVGPTALPFVELVVSTERHGTPLTDVLAQLSNEARQSRRRLDEAAARRLPVKLSFPLVTCTLPSFVLLAVAPAVLAAISSLGDSTW